MRDRPPIGWALAALCAACALALGGCTSTSPPVTPGAVTNTTAPPSTAATTAGPSESSTATTQAPRGDGVAILTPQSIPPGTVVQSKGPAVYTFREEWRRAIPVAWKWDKAAYLVQAFGSDVRGNGAASEWTMHFRSPASTDIGTLKIDATGRVTEWRTMPNRAPSTKSTSRAIQPTAIDSDKAVAAGAKRLAAYSAGSLSDRQLRLSWAEKGSGMRWFYTVFHAKSSSFISVEINALSGKVVGLKKYKLGEMRP